MVDDAQQAHQDVYGQDGQPDNQATFTGEALGGAAAFEAMRKVRLHFPYRFDGTRTLTELPSPLWALFSLAYSFFWLWPSLAFSFEQLVLISTIVRAA